ncbi:uncharacterized protein NEMAJ01_2367 [Nematocida major]|uniref:uncharacterized protein n=1 Tax=Nematocida major TaxID=1912982 RepID=UPI0020076A73|nr:uncharacterized protein NEMAJ01_2367 [Nematocida major]KAH9387471.1 hypothetical protein NEMAJ01_2367 [Nematocida major]
MQDTAKTREEYGLELLCPDGAAKRVSFIGEVCTIGTGPTADVKLSHGDALECVLDYKNDVLRVVSGRVKINGEIVTSELKMHYPCIIEAAERLFRITKAVIPQERIEAKKTETPPQEEQEESEEDESGEESSSEEARIFSIEESIKEGHGQWEGVSLTELAEFQISEGTEKIISDFLERVDMDELSNGTDRELEPEMHSDDVRAQEEARGLREMQEEAEGAFNLSRISIFEGIPFEDPADAKSLAGVTPGECSKQLDSELLVEAPAEDHSVLGGETLLADETIMHDRVNGAIANETVAEAIAEETVVEEAIAEETVVVDETEVADETVVEPIAEETVVVDEAVVETIAEVDAEPIAEVELAEPIADVQETIAEETVVEPIAEVEEVNVDAETIADVQETIVEPIADVELAEFNETVVADEPIADEVNEKVGSEPAEFNELNETKGSESISFHSEKTVTLEPTEEPTEESAVSAVSRTAGDETVPEICPGTPSTSRPCADPVTPGRSIRRASISHQLTQMVREKEPAKKKRATGKRKKQKAKK